MTKAEITMNAVDRFPPLTVSRQDLLSEGSDGRFRLAIYRLVQAASRFSDCREGFGREMDLTGSQFVVLMGVTYQQGENGVTIAALATHVGLAATHVTTEVGRLSRLGMLQKRPNENDRRSVLVKLTSKGEAAIRSSSPLVRRINDILFESIEAHEMECVLRIAEKIVRNSDRALSELRLFEMRRLRD